MGKKKSAIPNFGNTRTSPMKMRTRMMTEAEIQKIKEDAVEQALKILENKHDIQEIKTDAYNEAIVDATKYFILCGCKVLNEQFGFGYKRLARFVDGVADLEVDTEAGKTSLEALEKWLDVNVGMILASKNIDDAIREKEEAKNGSN